MSGTTLPGELYSPEHLGVVIIELRNFIARMNDREVRKKVTGATGEAMPPLSRLAERLLQANELTPSKLEGIEQLLKKLEAIRTEAPTVHIVLAELPDATLRQQLADWFRTQADSHTLLTFAMRSDIGGGLLLQSGSHLYDFSFRTQLLANKQRLAEILTHGRK
ncbi:MAG TPA: F0F1 ATP synthase subunit delta [Candidatus Saccharimonadales bacterium]|nr:F0F1 ATP synthase subunit delta [Candidatus Saccharimonadales bacterium]